MPGGYPPIGSLAAVGDGHSIALFGPDSAVEWFCPRRFDAAPLVWPLLDRSRGGTLRIAPVAPLETRARYVGETAVLEYEWQTSHGRAVMQVCMAWPSADRDRPHRNRLLWLVRGLVGEVELEVRFAPRPGFGRERFELHPHERGVEARSGGLRVALLSPGSLQHDAKQAEGHIRIAAGQKLAFELQAPAIPGAGLRAEEIADVVASTSHAWREWSSAIRWEGAHRDDVVRSAITLKLLIYEPTGSVVAEATTSLPEALEGVRNWDYRYTWLRDASFTVNALHALGCRREANRYARWMLRTTAEHGLPLRALYGIAGETRFPEFDLPEVEGYRGSAPVRIGNGAEHQFQLDSYGELLDCVTICEVLGDQTMRNEWPHLRRVVQFVADHWRDPDSGIWEVRDRPRHFVYSKAMAWVTLDRGCRLARHFGLAGDLDRWASEADQLRRDVEEKGLVAATRRFARSYGEDAVDASLLLLPVVGYVDGRDPAALATLEAVRAELHPLDAVSRALLLRYPQSAGDGLPGHEGAFTLCSFWLVEALALAGRREEAEELFEEVCNLRGALGLYAEEMDPATGEHLGNLPQAFTHIGLINAALRLRDRSAKGKAVGPSSLEGGTEEVKRGLKEGS